MECNQVTMPPLVPWIPAASASTIRQMPHAFDGQVLRRLLGYEHFKKIAKVCAQRHLQRINGICECNSVFSRKHVVTRRNLLRAHSSCAMLCYAVLTHKDPRSARETWLDCRSNLLVRIKSIENQKCTFCGNQTWEVLSLTNNPPQVHPFASLRLPYSSPYQYPASLLRDSIVLFWKHPNLLSKQSVKVFKCIQEQRGARDLQHLAKIKLNFHKIVTLFAVH